MLNFNIIMQFNNVLMSPISLLTFDCVVFRMLVY